ncbi:PPOX class F420-dependent oxidoreductase [Streptomyces sp. NA04227]|uniref:PPOX class F420-dependent oxidoreductase n=1 Tax=Streptomyces sp. NA04227 TaxID=2742136 RepID=UPI001590A200|nr:PPOX class F420-dependent oxidoreductase [Streptomyces sp. NA04227]QKW09855.1 PPOX class F420-dependent oxidoreductase [Streptomyces sp. NA04227]
MIPDELRRARYVSLTTYRKDGTPVATPVWSAAEGDELYVWTNVNSWKVKRLRRDPRVVVAVCDVRGRIPDGATQLAGTGRLLDADGLKAVRKRLARKYTWQWWLADWPATVARRGKRPHAGIAVRL